MKKIVLLIIVLFNIYVIFSQSKEVALEINGKPIYKQEFLQIYLKNNNNPKFDKKSIDEYLDLFKKFKLIVIEAENLGYDTLSKLKAELSDYRKTQSKKYLYDKEVNNKLVEQAYDRLKKEIRTSHILINIKSNNPVDTLMAYNKISDLRTRIINGEDFNLLAKEYSNDPSAALNYGDIGYFTALQMVYPFEEAAFNLKIGEISSVVRTKFGYHLIKLTDQRPARGTIKVAHIMISVKKDAAKEELEIGRKKINEVYEKLKKGENFEDLAKNFSDDPRTSDKGGVLPEFGSGSNIRMVNEFENEAFKLKENGEFSYPFQTDFGFHIVKRLNHKTIGSIETMRKDIESKLEKDERNTLTKQPFIKKLKEEYNYKLEDKKSLKWFVKNIDSNYYKGIWNYDNLKSDRVIFSITDKKYTQKMFANYLKTNFRITKQDNKTLISKQYENWVNSEILKYEDLNLERKYPEFNSLMQELHDGVLKFEIMSDKVWNKAARDTLGLNEFYKSNIKNYQWKERYDAVVFECLDKKIAQNVTKILKINDSINSKHVLQIVNKTSEFNVNVKTNRYEIDELIYTKGRKMIKGINPIIEFNNKFYVIKISKFISPEPKTIKEVKGILLNDYQNHLEQEWIKELMKKYSIKINEEVIYNLQK